MELKYKLRIVLAFAAFFGPIIGYGLFGDFNEGAATLATLILTFYIMGMIFVLACVGTGIEWTIRYLFTNKGAG